MAFLWIKTFHIIAVICWFAAIFYLPRLFVYHAMSDDKASDERFKIMERKLYRGIMTPSAVVSVVLGAWMMYQNWAVYQQQYWLLVKLLMVAGLIIFHLLCGIHLKNFQQNKNQRSHTYFRWFNEVPVLLLVGIIIMVVIRPF